MWLLSTKNSGNILWSLVTICIPNVHKWYIQVHPFFGKNLEENNLYLAWKQKMFIRNRYKSMSWPIVFACPCWKLDHHSPIFDPLLKLATPTLSGPFLRLCNVVKGIPHIRDRLTLCICDYKKPTFMLTKNLH